MISKDTNVNKILMKCEYLLTKKKNNNIFN